jgi:hypothetical protein
MPPRKTRIAEERTANVREAGMRSAPTTHYQSKLYVPPNKIPSGVTYSWVRETTLNEPDPDNMTDRMVRGWHPVPASRHPEMVPPPLPGYEGIEAQVIRRGGLMLCERPSRDVAYDRNLRDRENLEMLQDVAWTGHADPNLPRFEDRDSGVNFERVTSFKE